MDLSLSSFQKIASTGSRSKIIEFSENNGGSLKSAGFWGRLFGAGRDRDRNRVSIERFLNAIEREKGKKAYAYARQLLITAQNSGKPLSAFMIRGVMKFIKSEEERIKKYNASVIDKYLSSTSLQPSLFEQCLASLLPEDVALEQVDISGIETQMRFLAESKSPLPSLESMDTLTKTMFMKTLSSYTNKFHGFLRDISKNGLTDRLTPEKVTQLIPLIVETGIRTESGLETAVDMACFFKENIVRPRNIENANDALQFLMDLGAAFTRSLIDCNAGPNCDQQSIFTFSLRMALQESGLEQTDLIHLRDQFGYGLINEAVRVLEYAQLRFPSDEFEEMVQMSRMLKSAFETVTPKPLAIQPAPPLTKMPEECMIFLKLQNLLLRDDKTKTLFRQSGINMLVDFSRIGKPELVRLLTSLNNGTTKDLRDRALLFAAGFLPALKKAQPDGKPFTPETLWTCLFNEPLPRRVNSDNIMKNIEVRWVETYTNAIGNRKKIEKFEVSWFFPLFLGVNPLQMLKLFTSAEPDKALSFKDCSIPFHDSIKPSERNVEAALKLAAKDLHRRSQPSKIILPGTGTILLSGTLMSEDDQKDYFNSGTDNPIIRQIKEFTDLILEGKKHTVDQVSALIILLGQQSTNIIRNCSFFLTQPFSEHCSTVVEATILENHKIHLSIETTDSPDNEDVSSVVDHLTEHKRIMPNQELGASKIKSTLPPNQRKAKLAFDVNLDGSYDLVDLYISEIG